MKTVRILCVGIGGYANVGIGALLEHYGEGYEIAGLVDPFPDGCRYLDALKAKGIPLYGSMEDFYREKSADLAILTTPIHLHTRGILLALSHGTNVLCEKPLSGDPDDAALINAAAEKAGRFVMIGYQWSYSRAINALKEDVLAGLYGAPVLLKTMVLWPRDFAYFTRGTGWAGRLYAKDGTPMFDSIANNAAAHYLHNMLYVTGKTGCATRVTSLSADLLRVNDIENFDTAVIRFELEGGGTGLFVASHNTEKNSEPCFLYRFEKGTVTYSEEQGKIIGKGEFGERDYGDPFADVTVKFFEAIEACRTEGYLPKCGVDTALSHALAIRAVQGCEVREVARSAVIDDGTWRYVPALDTLLPLCYEEETMLFERKDAEVLL